MSSSLEIRKLEDENKELKLRAYQKKLEQENKKLLTEINNNNEEDNETNNEHDDECEVTGDEREAEKKEMYKYILGAILAYTLLMLFVFSALYIIHQLRRHGCGGPAAHWYYEQTVNATNEIDIKVVFTEIVYKKCIYYLQTQFNQNSAIVSLHNLTFGLVSAVVVSKIGSHQQQQQSQQNKLMTNQLLHATKATPGSHIRFRLVYNFVMWTPRIYVLTWIFIGCLCLICGSMWGSDYSGPLYVTGQTWLGIAITTVYLFFGLQATAKENNKTKKEKDSVVDEHNDDDSGVDRIDADYSKHNDKNEKCEREENNAVTSSALLQTTTSRSRFVEEKDGDDEEEGTLYLSGTKGNDNRNHDNAADDSGRSLFETLSH